MNTLPNKKVLESLIQSTQGEICFVEDEQRYYILTEDGWSPINIEADGDGVHMSLYELNKNIISQLPVITEEGIDTATSLISEYRVNTNNKYYALICKEYGYYTMFNTREALGELPNLSTGVFECLSNVGEVITVNQDEGSGAIEIWVIREEEIFYFILFVYYKGVLTNEQ